MGHHSSIVRSSARVAIVGAEIAKAGLAQKPAVATLKSPPPPRERQQGKALAKVAPIDATPERRAKAFEDGVELFVMEDAAIDKAGEKALITRRFRDNQIDRAFAAKRITHAQWFAAGYYLAASESSGLSVRMVANYGDSASGAGGCSYGMPRTFAQAAARRRLRAAREAMGPGPLVWLDRAVLEDNLPTFTSGHVRQRFWKRIAEQLQKLADAISAPDES